MIDKSLPYIIFGAGSAARDWIFSNNNLEILFFVDNDETKWGINFFNYEVRSPNCLKEFVGIANILIVSVYVKDIRFQLEKIGFKWNLNIFSDISSNFYILIDGVSVEKFFYNLDVYKVNYVVLRNYSSLPENVGGDVDLLVLDNDINSLSKCGLEKTEYIRESNYLNKLKFDIYSVYGSPGYRYRNMALYTPEKSLKILQQRIKYKNLFYVPSQKDYQWSFLYYVCYFKHYQSGLPLKPVKSLKRYRSQFISSSGWVKRDNLSSQVRNNLIEKCENIFPKELKTKICLSTIHKYLESIGHSPTLSSMRRLIGNLDEVQNLIGEKSSLNNLIRMYKICDEEIKGLYVYFIRKRTIKLKALNLIEKFLKDNGLKIITTHFLKSDLKLFSKYIRGGNWYDDYGKKINGEPYILIFALDEKKEPLSKSQKSLSIPFVNYSSYFIKDALRNHLFKIFPSEKKLNLFHTTDDVLEVLETIFYLPSPDKAIIIKKLISNLGNKEIFSKL
tara:strand:+ start:60716 stop:62224 length:1509 start_codon:yes stop_codon:yes gene_type:complete